MNNIFEVLKKVSRRKNIRYGANSFILIAVVVAIAVVVNMLAGMKPLKIDLTPNKLYTISDTTKDILKGLNKDVTIYGLFDDGKITIGNQYKDVTELLNQYSKYAHLKIEYVDPDKNPGFIKEVDPEGLKAITNDDFVIKCGDKIKKLSYYDLFTIQVDQQTYQQTVTGTSAEESFTGAIKYVTSDVTPVVYFLQGHDEIDMTTQLTTLQQYIGMNNCDVKTINLLTDKKVPDDAALILVASPKRDLSSDESYKIKEYLDNGGKGVFLFDSLETGSQFTEFEGILKEYNVSLNYDKVKENDSTRHAPDNAYDIIPDVLTNVVIENTFNMVMPKSRSLNILKNQKEYINVIPLMRSSDKAVGEQIGSAGANDIPGPLDLAVAVEDNGGLKPVKILVMGNASFLTDSAVQAYGSYSSNSMLFFLTSLSWLQGKVKDVVIVPKSYETPRLTINAAQSTITGIAVVIFFPLVIFIAGLLVFMRRRHL